MAKYRHIVFDIDGTLIDTQYAVQTGLRDTVRNRLGKDMSYEELIFSFGIPGLTTLTMLGLPDPKAALVEWNEHIGEYRHTIVMFPGIEEMMNSLPDVSVGVVTSKNSGEYRDDFMHFPISRFITHAVCADHTEKHKPEPDPLYKYMELTGAKPEEVLYVGDSVYDQRCAHSAGVDFALATWGAANKEIVSEWYPATPMELIDIIG